MKKIKNQELIDKTLESLRTRGLSDASMKHVTAVFAKFNKFCFQKNEIFYKIELADAFLVEYYNLDVGVMISWGDQRNPDKFSPYQRKYNRIMRYLNDMYTLGYISLKMKGSLQQISLSKEFEYLLNFFVECRNKENYSEKGTYTIANRVKNFLIYLENIDIYTLRLVNAQKINHYFLTKCSLTSKSLSAIAVALRAFFLKLYLEEKINTDLSLLVPIIKVTKSLKVPQVWSKNDSLKLINSIDKANPRGKRDYAILLMIMHYGLRSSDMKELKLSAIDWNNNQINIVQSKTGKLLTLPILHDVGWALADYLQNGRIKCDISNVFLPLNAPPRPFGKNSQALTSMLRSRMNDAHIELPRHFNHGMHALRHTLASVMIANEVDLQTISSILGHTNTKATSIYLHTDMIRLKDCVLDPEEIKRESDKSNIKAKTTHDNTQKENTQHGKE